MSGNWGKLECPDCGHQVPPQGAASDCEGLILDLVCPQCRHDFEIRVELWRYYGIVPELPSREDDR